MAIRPLGAKRDVQQPINRALDIETAQLSTDDDNPDVPPDQPEARSTLAGGALNHSEDSSAVGSAGVASKKQRRREYNREYQREYQRKLRQRNHGKRVSKVTKTNGSAIAVTTRKAATQTTLDVTHILFCLHQVGALLLKIPSLAITEDEAKQLAAATARLMDLYEIPLLDEKTRAWANLGLVGVEVYGTRITAAIVERKKKAPSPQIITPFHHHD